MADCKRGNGICKGGSKMIGATVIIAAALMIIVLCRLSYNIGSIDGYDEGMEDAINTFQMFYTEKGADDE